MTWALKGPRPRGYDATLDGRVGVCMRHLVAPGPDGLAGSSLGQELLSLRPSFIAYVTSFMTILIMWINHHNLFSLVGALALDAEGDLSAACSTGGLSLKLPGRIGDSAILGAGLYAENSAGAATATGVGEMAIRTAMSKSACELMQTSSAQAAAKKSITRAGKRIGRGLGIVTLDARGRYGVAHNTHHLCWAAIVASGKRTASMFGARL